ncbi:MAG: YrhK family protein [Psychromonas sp.]
MKAEGNDLVLDLGSEHIIIQRRYEVLGALNDFLIAVWFLIGSFFFFSEALVESGTWLFVAGSAQLLIKPTIKLAGLVHVSRLINKNQSKKQ